jgi:hypothetical protein
MPRAGQVEVNLFDADRSTAIDTVVYLRSSCNDRASQLACSDDIDCSDSTVPGPGGCAGMTELRQSIIETRLEAGTYYIVADAFDYSSSSVEYGCGRVSLTVTVD